MIWKMTDKPKPDFVSFDAEEFTEYMEKLASYFISKVKLINSVGLEKVADEWHFDFDIPSTDLVLKMVKAWDYEKEGGCYLVTIDMFPYKLSCMEVREKQFNRILESCRKIDRHAKNYIEDYKENRKEVLSKLKKKIGEKYR